MRVLIEGDICAVTSPISRSSELNKQKKMGRILGNSQLQTLWLGVNWYLLH